MWALLCLSLWQCVVRVTAPPAENGLSQDLEAALMTSVSPTGHSTQVLGLRGLVGSKLAWFSEGPLGAKPCGHSREAEHSLPAGRLPGLLLLGRELQLQ